MILDQKSSSPCLHISGYGAANIYCVAETSVGIRYDRNVNDGSDGCKILLHLFIAEKAGIRHAFGGCGGESGHEGKIKFGALDELGGESVVATWHEMDAGLFEEMTEFGSWGVG